MKRLLYTGVLFCISASCFATTNDTLEARLDAAKEYGRVSTSSRERLVDSIDLFFDDCMLQKVGGRESFEEILRTYDTPFLPDDVPSIQAMAQTFTLSEISFLTQYHKSPELRRMKKRAAALKEADAAIDKMSEMFTADEINALLQKGAEANLPPVRKNTPEFKEACVAMAKIADSFTTNEIAVLVTRYTSPEAGTIRKRWSQYMELRRDLEDEAKVNVPPAPPSDSTDTPEARRAAAKDYLSRKGAQLEKLLPQWSTSSGTSQGAELKPTLAIMEDVMVLVFTTDEIKAIGDDDANRAVVLNIQKKMPQFFELSMTKIRIATRAMLKQKQAEAK